MSNEFVMLPRAVAEAAWQAQDDDGRFEESCPLREALDKPAEQHQGEPVAWGAWRKSLKRFHYVHDDGEYMKNTYGQGSESAQDFDLIPLYKRTDAEFIAMLERDRKAHCAAIHLQAGELAELRAHLAERDALLRDWYELSRRGIGSQELHARTVTVLERKP